MSDTETTSVSIQVEAIEKMQGCGSLLAVAHVCVTIHDVEIRLLGCQIRQLPDGRHVARPPQWRYRGQWIPCIAADESLTAALGAELNSAYEEMMACA